MGSHFKERPYDPASRLTGMFVKFPTLETMEILAGAGLATQWGMDGPEEYRRGGDEGIVRVPMIEDPEAVEDIERMLTIPGLDAAFIGQGDLTQTTGDRETAQALVSRALNACLEHG